MHSRAASINQTCSISFDFMLRILLKTDAVSSQSPSSLDIYIYIYTHTNMDVYSHGMKRRQSACGALFKNELQINTGKMLGPRPGAERGVLAFGSPALMPLGAEPCA